jgi:amino acid adenylation domain-containing protein
MAPDYPDAKRKLLEKYLRGELGVRPASQQIPRRTPGQPIPLSHAQEQVWLHAQMVPELPLYNEPVTIHYAGPLDGSALERGFNEILHRHEAWRTSFRVVDGEPVQEVHENLSVSLPVLDLRHLPREQRNTVALQIATADARVPMDLGQVPLFRARVIRLDDEECRLYLALNHIIFDGVALYRVFLPELAALYEAYAAGKPSPLPDLSIQYPDYACWERRTATPEALAKDIGRWREQLDRSLPEVYLPGDRRPRHPRTFRGSMFPFKLRSNLTEAVRAFCRREGVSVFHVLLAAFAALLQRYSGEQRIPIGTVTAGRNLPETNQLLGYFLNTVVLPADVSGDPSFRELVRRARNWSLDALAHDRVPFETLVRELKVERDPRRNPLFQALFSLEPPLPEIDPSWRLTQMDVDTETTKYDLYLEMDERSDEVLARFHYSTDLFEHESIRRMALHWKTLLRDAVENPERRISELPLLTAREVRRLSGLTTEQEFPNACVHELFEQQARENPDAVAVAAQDSRMSYRELNECANQLACYLVSRGVGPDVPVGISMDRGLRLPVALLGILKAGGAYVPLDPRLPVERLDFLVTDAKTSFVLTDQGLQHRNLHSGAIVQEVSWKIIEQESKANPERRVSPANLAYVIYTSGSTGAPKGVAIEHHSVVNVLSSMQRQPGLSANDVLLAVTTLSFDIAALEIFLPLITGARVVIAGSTDIVDGTRLKDLLSDSNATVMQATPATWRLLLEAGWQGGGHLKILCGGEPFSPELAQELTLRSNSVWNVYGPTETTIWSSIYRVTGREDSAIPIGRPVANTSIYILDSHRNRVPVNVTGEIYIGGEGVARGYVNRPEMTAERFVRNWLAPGHAAPGQGTAGQRARLYRTGDLGRWRGDGEIEYLGRVDTQIKLRGQRIELGEIESVLASYDAVREAVVTVRGESEQQKLAAYVVLKEEAAAPSAAELRRYLRTKLPEAMVPAGYWQIAKVPLLPSGKVNRGGLAASGGVALADREEKLAPRNETEKQLAAIWKELLKVEDVGVEENFFELGGHSLLVLQMTARIRRQMEVELAVRAVFEAPTIAGLAQEVERARAQGLTARAPVLHHRSANADEDAVLTQLDNLSADEARRIVRNILNEKTGRVAHEPGHKS